MQPTLFPLKNVDFFRKFPKHHIKIEENQTCKPIINFVPTLFEQNTSPNPTDLVTNNIHQLFVCEFIVMQWLSLGPALKLLKKHWAGSLKKQIWARINYKNKENVCSFKELKP